MISNMTCSVLSMGFNLQKFENAYIDPEHPEWSRPSGEILQLNSIDKEM